MALIDKTNLLGITDRISKRFDFLQTAAISGSPDGSGLFYTRCHINTADGDPIVELPTLTLANSSDSIWTEDTVSTVTDAMVGASSSSFAIIGGLTTHFTKAGLTGGWNQYLEQQTNTLNPTDITTNTGVRVSEYFRRVYAKIGGGTTLRAKNVFYEAPLGFVFGTAEVTNAAGDVIQFWSGGSLNSTGNPSYSADGSHFAATQLCVVPVGNSGGAIGATDLDIVLQVKKEDGTTTSVEVTLPSGTTNGTKITVGTVNDRFVSVTAVSMGTNKGTDGDRFEVQNIVERSPQL